MKNAILCNSLLKKVLQPCTLIFKKLFFILIACHNIYRFITSAFISTVFFCLQILYFTVLIYGVTEIKDTNTDIISIFSWPICNCFLLN